MNSVEQDVQRWVLRPPDVSVPDREVPAGIEASDLAAYCLMLGDDALVLAHRMSEWGLRTPDLEEGAELGSLTMGLLAEARALLRRAGELEGEGRDEDQLAYFRDARQFRNVRLVEIDCGPGAGGDFAATVARSLVFAIWRRALYERLAELRDPVLSALASRLLPGVTHHRDHAAQWMIRLGDGSAHARRRMLAGLELVWPLIAELLHPHEVETRLARADCAVNPALLREEVATALDQTASVARMELPDVRAVEFSGGGGRAGEHTESMDFVIADLQHIARADSPAAW